MTQRHAPLKPLWVCTADLLNWPCENAKVELVADYEHDRRHLAVDLAALMRQATDDLTRLYSGPPDPAEMHIRFLGWLRSVRNV